jgi:protein-S-isoprenylcysteine O-methyltransferase Ste14
MGEAPRLFAYASPALLAAVAPTALWPDAFGFLGKFYGVGIAAGIVLASLGLVFWISAAVALIRAYREDRLATGGAYGLSRHPIIAWWVFFVLPPVALITNSWLFLGAALALGLLALPFMRAEEAELSGRFGEAHGAYRARVRMLFPLPRIRPLTLGRLAAGAGLAALAAAVAAASFFLLVRPVMLGLGVSRAEREASWPGDEYIANVRSGYTQAIEIDAPPEAVWPWLVQVGHKRAGWYNVDAINRMADPNYFYEGGRSARRIIAELQQLDVGERIHLVPQLGLTVVQAMPERRLLLVGNPDAPEAASNAVWLFELQPLAPAAPARPAAAAGSLNADNAHAARDAAGTRLIVRFQSTFPGGLLARILNGFVNEIGGAIIQQPAMLHGLKARAEKAHAEGRS